jgi:hypothetical protein
MSPLLTCCLLFAESRLPVIVLGIHPRQGWGERSGIKIPLRAADGDRSGRDAQAQYPGNERCRRDTGTFSATGAHVLGSRYRLPSSPDEPASFPG